MDEDNENATSGAEAQANALQYALEAGAWIEFFSRNRDDGVANADILKWHKEGIETKRGRKVRDILANDADADAMSNLFVEQMDKMLDRVGEEAKGKAITPDKAAKQGLAGGLRAAAKYLTKKIAERLVDQKDNRGVGLLKCEDDYADERAKRFGIGQTVVFYRTGQLAASIADGRYRLDYDPSKVADIANNAGK